MVYASPAFWNKQVVHGFFLTIPFWSGPYCGQLGSVRFWSDQAKFFNCLVKVFFGSVRFGHVLVRFEFECFQLSSDFAFLDPWPCYRFQFQKFIFVITCFYPLKKLRVQYPAIIEVL